MTSASATSATSVTLNFASPEIANLFSIGQVYIVSQHIWSKVADPSTYADTTPVGTGPYVLDHFSPQGITMKENTKLLEQGLDPRARDLVPGLQQQLQPGAAGRHRPD